MPNIKQYTRQNLPSQLVARQNTSGAFGSGDGMMNLAKGVGEVQAKLEEIKQKRERLEYVNKLTAYQIETQKVAQELSTSDLPPDADFSELYSERYNQISSEFEQSVPESMQEAWAQDNASLRLNFVTSGMQEQVRRAGVRAKDDWDNLTTSVGNLVSLGQIDVEGARKRLEEGASAFPNMPSEDKRSFVESALDTVRANEATRLLDGSIENLSEFNRRVENGDFSNLPNLGKYLSESQKIKQQIRKDNESALEKIELLSSGTLDPTNRDHKNILDDHYNQFEVGGQSFDDGIKNMDSGVANLAFEFVKKYNIVPDSMQSTLRGMMNGGSLEQKQFAYEFVGDIQSSNAYGFSKNSQIMENYNSYFGLTNAGYSGKDAIDVIEVINSPDQKKRVEINRSKLSSGEISFDAEETIKDIYGDGWFNIAPKNISEIAIADANTVWEHEYLKTGNADAATAVAQKLINNKYNQTEIMGEEKIMDYPPEISSGHPSLSVKENRKWQQARLKKDLKSLGYSENLKQYDLQSIFENEDAVNQGEKPRYYIIDKSTNDYVRDKENNVLVYHFDPDEIDKQVKTRTKEGEIRNLSKVARKQYVRNSKIDPEKDYFDRFLIEVFDRHLDMREGFADIFRGEDIE